MAAKKCSGVDPDDVLRVKIKKAVRLSEENARLAGKLREQLIKDKMLPEIGSVWIRLLDKVEVIVRGIGFDGKGIQNIAMTIEEFEENKRPYWSFRSVQTWFEDFAPKAGSNV